MVRVRVAFNFFFDCLVSTKNKIHANYHISSTLKSAPSHSVVAPHRWPPRSSAPEQQLPRGRSVAGFDPSPELPSSGQLKHNFRLENPNEPRRWPSRFLWTVCTNAITLVSQSANSLLRGYLADRSRRFKRVRRVSQPVAPRLQSLLAGCYFPTRHPPWLLQLQATRRRLHSSQIAFQSLCVFSHH